MKILIFENEFPLVESAFLYVNKRYFKDTLELTIKIKSQDLSPFKSIEDFDHVLIDISLGMKSNLDGIGILKRIKEESLNVKNITIMTADILIDQKLKELNLNTYPTLFKPISILKLKEVFER